MLSFWAELRRATTTQLILKYNLLETLHFHLCLFFLLFFSLFFWGGGGGHHIPIPCCPLFCFSKEEKKTTWCRRHSISSVYSPTRNRHCRHARPGCWKQQNDEAAAANHLISPPINRCSVALSNAHRWCEMRNR